MRDLLPEETRERRHLAQRVLERLALHGYDLVLLPAFEFADVLERGLGALDPSEVLRFVEPESGEVAAFRPDMTPQIARMIATRLHERPQPLRIAYEGTVVRRRSGRARKHRQIPQVGVELAGITGPAGDIELLALAVEAMQAAGLQRFTLDLGDAGVVRALLASRPPAEQARLSDAMGRKDEGAIDDPVLRAVATMQGGREVLVEGSRLLASTRAAEPARRLLALFDAAVERGLGPHLVADLGEVRGFAYYTATIFHAYADGTGDAIVSGGRYDELLGRFGCPMPAAGFAVDLDRAAEALRAAGVKEAVRTRIVAFGPGAEARAAELRAKGTVAVTAPSRGGAMEWARAWGFTHVLDASTGASIAAAHLGEEVHVQEREGES
jgi:ATP phosphoribosyltransferase regulatory subunit